MRSHYHFHIQNFVQISSSQMNELLENHKEKVLLEKEAETVMKFDALHATQPPKMSFMRETFGSFQEKLALGLGNTFAAELVLKVSHLLKMLRF